MKLSSLLPVVADHPDVKATLSSYPHTPVGHITALAGMRPALVPLLYDTAQRSGNRVPLIYVCASGREAESFSRTLSQFMNGVAYFPAWETLPHERLSPRADTMARRIETLRRLRHPDNRVERASGINVIVMPVRALLQPVIADLADREPLLLRQRDIYPMEEVVDKLVALGFTGVDMVETRGQFAVRGGILDVFAPTEDHPVRIEFFGDEIDEIRYFSIADQRTLTHTEYLWTSATKELLLDDKVRQRALDLQKTLPGIADMLERIHNGIAMEGMESLSAVLADKVCPVTDLFPEGTRIIIADEQRVCSRVDDLLATTKEFEQAAWEAAAAGGNVPVETVAQSSFLELDAAREHAIQRQMSWWSLSTLAPTDDVDTHQIEAREPRNYMGDIDAFLRDVRDYSDAGFSVVIATEGQGRAQRIATSLKDLDIPAVCERNEPVTLHREDGRDTQRIVYVTAAHIDDGFIAKDIRLAVFSERNMTGKSAAANREIRKLPARRSRNVVDPLALKKGDFIVHEFHGVGKFIELVTRTIGRGKNAVTREYLEIEYAAAKKGRPADRLFVPSDQLDLITKYNGSDSPSLNKMGGSDWARAKRRARKATHEIAAELVRLYAARQSSQGFAFSPDTPWQRELEDAFSHIETPDQLTTIDEVKRDMEQAIPMDRLLCGDVGYGKTEVAVRAAFKAVQDGKQVAVLVPTTLLVQQHEETFSDRYAGFPVRVAALSRFTSQREADEIKDGLREGSIDVVIGTHTLVTGQVRFKDLGLVIIDEEQRFGVEHKETLKALRTNVDVLSMSATPIPRTLEMAVSGIRDMSVLQTPPEERRPVLTHVGAYQDKQMAAAIKRELLRDGQVFYVHNRVQDISRIAKHISDVVPEARVRIAHGQMAETELERVMVDFWNHEFDVLVCTTIVETGLDIANANTLIVDQADKMGLSQMHQLRGRVGRGRERAYAYFFFPPKNTLTQTAHDRLETIASHTDLGSGIAVAQKDLEIRGAGNLLGGQQSGHIAGVGFDLYIRMVAEAVELYRQGSSQPAVQQRADIKIELPIDAHIPASYIPSERLRLETYGKLAAASGDNQIAQVREELIDRYGKIPPQVELLFTIEDIREKARHAGLTEIMSQGRYIRFGPVELKDSQMLRLKRLYPGSMIKTALRQVLVPAPVSSELSQQRLHDEELAQWIAQVIQTVIVPFG
ncbi:MAG: transcription-repair coupling factor [Actinomycetaceae bacterium]|nr:transcription-repair coupling factor [Actinomycetaceae bacterium]